VSTPIESPCVDVCQIDQSHGVCRGCFRTLGEIAGWGTMSPTERRAIMRDLPSRKKNNPLS